MGEVTCRVANKQDCHSHSKHAIVLSQITWGDIVEVCRSAGGRDGEGGAKLVLQVRHRACSGTYSWCEKSQRT